MSIHVTPLRKAVSTNVSLTPNATNPIRLDTCEIKKWKKAMTAKYDESVQEQEKSYQIHSNVSSDAVTEVLFAPDSTPAKTPDTRIPISLETCTPVLGTASTSTPATSTGYLISNLTCQNIDSTKSLFLKDDRSLYLLKILYQRIGLQNDL